MRKTHTNTITRVARLHFANGAVCLHSCCCHSATKGIHMLPRTVTNTRTHSSRTRTHYELLLLNTRAISLAYLKAHSPRSFFIFIWFDRFIVYAQLIGWDSFKRMRGRRIDILSNCVRVALEPPANVSSTRHQLFLHPTHARTQYATNTKGAKYINSKREPWLLT